MPKTRNKAQRLSLSKDEDRQFKHVAGIYSLLASTNLQRVMKLQILSKRTADM